MNNKQVFLVSKEGVYRHEIMGVYQTQEEAEKRAIAISGQPVTDFYGDGDGYHRFCVRTALIGEDVDDFDVVKTYQREVQRRLTNGRTKYIYGEVKEVSYRYTIRSK